MSNIDGERFLNHSCSQSNPLTVLSSLARLLMKLSPFQYLNLGVSSTFVHQTKLLLTCCIFLFTLTLVQSDSGINILPTDLYYDKLSYTPTFGTYKLLVQYKVDPSDYLSNTSFSLVYLKDNSYSNFQSNPTPYLSGNTRFDGEIDIFNYNANTFNNNLVLNFEYLQLTEMRFLENTNTNHYKYIILKKKPSSPYRIVFTKFDLIEIPRLYDRHQTGVQTVSIPTGLTEKFVCNLYCSSTYIDVNDLDAKASYTVTVSPVASGYVIYITLQLSNNFEGIYGWASVRTFTMKESKLSLSYTSNTNSVNDLYIEVTAINCTFNGQPASNCPFSYSVTPNNKKNLSSGSADTAIVVTAIILSLIILMAIVLSSGYFYYRYSISKKYEEARLNNLREMTSRAQMSLANGSNIQAIDESQRPHDPFVRLDKLHGYSLDSSTHFIMDAHVPKVTINLTTPSTPEPVVQYGVDTKRLSSRVDVPVDMDTIKLDLQNEKDTKL